MISAGIGALLLDHLIEEGRNRGYKVFFFETGAMEFFIPARRLYEKFAFEYCGPFGDYREDPNSVFMKKRL